MTGPRTKSRLDRVADGARVGEVGRIQPWLVRWLRFQLRFARVLARPRFEGLPNLPAAGPFVIVSNHSGGGLLEVHMLTMLWADVTRGERLMTALTHPLTYRLGGRFTRDYGMVPSTYRAGLDALAAGIPLIVFPGGDHECFRPIWQDRRVDFNGRQGFLRLAREARVPIVPMGIVGSGWVTPVLWRSEGLLPWILGYRLFGMKRFPLMLTGLVGAIGFSLAGLFTPLGWWGLLLAWLWLAGPLQFVIPVIPRSIAFRLGAPIPPEEMFGDEEGPLAPAYDRVIAEIVALRSGAPARPGGP